MVSAAWQGAHLFVFVTNRAAEAAKALLCDLVCGVGPVVCGEPVLLCGGRHWLVHTLFLGAAGALAASLLQGRPQLVGVLLMV